MAANYPTIIRKFQPHKDATEYVLAAHMNDAQSEIMAIESTLGARPATYNPATGSPTSYTTVGSRLDSIQQASAVQQTQINGLLDASQNGWALPIASIVASGTNIPPTQDANHHAVPSDWYRVRWTSALVDSDSIFASGFYVTIPKTGWWVVTTTSTMPNPSQTVDVDHNVWTRVKVDGVGTTIVPYEIGAADSSIAENAGDWHRMTTASGDALFAGDRIYLEVRHDYIATDPSHVNRQTLSASARIQLTYVRALPPGTNGRISTYFLPDELDPSN